MGNFFAKNKMVKPLYHKRDLHGLEGLNQPSRLRVKVRMTASQLKELMEKVDLSKDTSNLCRLIVQECIEGKLTARVMAGQSAVPDIVGKRSLETISEEADH